MCFLKIRGVKLDLYRLSLFSVLCIKWSD